jgi:hypothetical protein
LIVHHLGNALRSAIVPFYSLVGIDPECVKRLGGPPKPNKEPKAGNATFTVEHVHFVGLNDHKCEMGG